MDERERGGGTEGWRGREPKAGGISYLIIPAGLPPVALGQGLKYPLCLLEGCDAWRLNNCSETQLSGETDICSCPAACH